MLTRKKPETLAAFLKFKAQGVEIELPLVFHNRSQTDVEKWLEENPGKPVTLYIVKSWESDYELNEAGVAEAEADWPNLNLSILMGFYQARQVALKGN